MINEAVTTALIASLFGLTGLAALLVLGQSLLRGASRIDALLARQEALVGTGVIRCSVIDTGVRAPLRVVPMVGRPRAAAVAVAAPVSRPAVSVAGWRAAA